MEDSTFMARKGEREAVIDIDDLGVTAASRHIGQLDEFTDSPSYARGYEDMVRLALGLQQGYGDEDCQLSVIDPIAVKRSGVGSIIGTGAAVWDFFASTDLRPGEVAVSTIAS